MTIRWPRILQQCPLIDGFSASAEDNIVQFKSETGPGKTRPKQTNDVVTASVTIICDKSQRNALWYFYRKTTQYSSLRWHWPDLDDAIDGAPHTYQMTPPRFSPYGVAWKAKLQVNGWASVDYLTDLLFTDDANGGFFLPEGTKWQNSSQTAPADTTGDPVAVWGYTSGTSNAVAPGNSSRPEID